MRLALATCRDLRPEEVDDLALHDALRARGALVEHPCWDDPSVDWHGFDGVLIRTTWDYTGRRDAFVAWAIALGDRVHNPGPIVRWNTHKGYLRELEQAGVPVVPTVWVRADDRSPLPMLPDAPTLFVKPAVAANAEGTARFERGDPSLEGFVRTIQRSHGDVMIQPYLASVGTHGERSAIVVDGEVSHAVCKVPAPGDYRVQDDWGATDGPHELSPAELALVTQVCAGLPSGLLYGRIDWLLGPRGEPWVNEVELVEPSLFFRHGPHTAARLADAWLARLHVSR
jgi:glutathione synthase/RimK-type ligase-like ATP-grasp enzyme